VFIDTDAIDPGQTSRPGSIKRSAPAMWRSC
jgi:hypothetical protein